MKNTAQAQQMLDLIVTEFKQGDIVGMFEKLPLINDPNDKRPCLSWSKRNLLLMILQGTNDARSSSAWRTLGRFPIDWTKKVLILKPQMCYVCTEPETCQGFLNWNFSRKSYWCQTCNKEIKNMRLAIKENKASQYPKGFTTQTEYALENTYGKSIPIFEPTKEKPELWSLAEQLGIEIKFQSDLTGSSYGHTSNKKEIVLGTEEHQIFYHEFFHQCDRLSSGKDLKFRDDMTEYSIQEVIAELGACILSRMYGTDTKQFSYKYIEGYANHLKLDVSQAINKVLERVMRILNFIFSKAQELQKAQKGVIYTN